MREYFSLRLCDLQNQQPISVNTINRWFVVSVSIYIIVVLNFLEPFGITINGFIFSYHLMLSTYGVVSGVTLIAVFSLFSKLNINLYSANSLTLSLWIFLMVCSVSFSNWLYSQFLHFTISGWNNMYIPVRYFSELMPQFLAIYMLWGLLSWGLIFILQRSNPAQELATINQDDLILLPSDNQFDSFKVRKKQIVCFKTSDNYLEVYYLNENEQLQNRMIRSSMKKMLDRLDTNEFYRSHQSFVVNVAHIKGLKKVKNNHFLEMSYLDFDVSLARSNVKNIKSYLVN
ncbi:LytTR family transcriptional regulator [Aliiglaciecola sp. M165]|nr:LytTR family transcriptional regulator [Aliiglaciecola sp. M165]